MENKQTFDYFHANENEQYLFLQMPWMLIKDEKFKKLSGDAKILYSLLLNRTSLSAKNGWLDEHGRVYIIYTIEQIMSDLNCWEQKAIKSMKELREIGLVKSVRRGQGKPNFLYVMNFATSLKYQPKSNEEPSNPVNTLNCENHNSTTVKITNQELRESQFKNCENHNVVISVLNNKEPKENLKKEDLNSHTNFPSNPILSVLDVQPEIVNSEQNIESRVTPQATAEPKKEQKKEGLDSAIAQQYTKPSHVRYEYNSLLRRIQANISYGYILDTDPFCKDMLDEICHVITTTILTNYRDGLITMGNDQMPAEVVRSAFLKLTREDIEYFFECFARQTEPITKMAAYIRASLYRNYLTIHHHYSNRVQTDMPQFSKPKTRKGRERDYEELERREEEYIRKSLGYNPANETIEEFMERIGRRITAAKVSSSLD